MVKENLTKILLPNSWQTATSMEEISKAILQNANQTCRFQHAGIAFHRFHFPFQQSNLLRSKE
jgi:hypothetical protein